MSYWGVLNSPGPLCPPKKNKERNKFEMFQTELSMIHLIPHVFQVRILKTEVKILFLKTTFDMFS